MKHWKVLNKKQFELSRNSILSDTSNPSISNKIHTKYTPKRSSIADSSQSNRFHNKTIINDSSSFLNQFKLNGKNSRVINKCSSQIKLHHHNIQPPSPRNNNRNDRNDRNNDRNDRNNDRNDRNNDRNNDINNLSNGLNNQSIENILKQCQNQQNVKEIDKLKIDYKLFKNYIYGELHKQKQIIQNMLKCIIQHVNNALLEDVAVEDLLAKVNKCYGDIVNKNISNKFKDQFENDIGLQSVGSQLKKKSKIKNKDKIFIPQGQFLNYNTIKYSNNHHQGIEKYKEALTELTGEQEQSARKKLEYCRSEPRLPINREKYTENHQKNQNYKGNRGREKTSFDRLFSAMHNLKNDMAQISEISDISAARSPINSIQKIKTQYK